MNFPITKQEYKLLRKLSKKAKIPFKKLKKYSSIIDDLFLRQYIRKEISQDFSIYNVFISSNGKLALEEYKTAHEPIKISRRANIISVISIFIAVVSLIFACFNFFR